MRTSVHGSRSRARSEAARVNILTVHLWVAFVVAVLAVLAVWQRTSRRIALYVVTVQILIGIVLMVQGLKVPWYHAALAVLGWAGYMVANAMSRRGQTRNALIVAGASSRADPDRVLRRDGSGQARLRLARARDRLPDVDDREAADRDRRRPADDVAEARVDVAGPSPARC